VLALAGVLAGLGLMVGLLIAMAVWLTRRAAQAEAQVSAAWTALAQTMGLTVTRQRPPALAGTYRNRPLEVRASFGTQNNPDSTLVIYKVSLNALVSLTASKVRSLGVKYVPSGNAEIDQRFVFQSQPPELATLVVGDPIVRSLLERADADLRLTPWEAISHVNDAVDDSSRLKLMIDLAAETAEFVERQIGVSIPQQQPDRADYDRANMGTVIKVPRGLWPVLLVVGLLVLAACVCVALWPALSILWQESG
jgi:hypothetical protein